MQTRCLPMLLGRLNLGVPCAGVAIDSSPSGEAQWRLFWALGFRRRGRVDCGVKQSPRGIETGEREHPPYQTRPVVGDRNRTLQEGHGHGVEESSALV